ncbi:hypothetical protein [Fischerella sp. PCC 9605]|nr:hypothetical protein [Fischerella sp. PCC 9605]
MPDYEWRQCFGLCLSDRILIVVSNISTLALLTSEGDRLLPS